MPDKRFVLITGRSLKQGAGISIGKDLAEYREATTILEMSQADMARLGLHEGDTLRLKSRYGEATVKCRRDNLPEGIVFIAFGTTINQLVGPQTYTSGTPDLKGIEVEIEKTPV
jgi:formylmethanofuran dehydrogenase subunit D